MTNASFAHRIRAAEAQRGAVLITSLLLLLVMTLLGVASMRTAILDERMATNSALRSRAFQAAESAVPDALPAGWTEITTALCSDPPASWSKFDSIDLGDATEGRASVCYLEISEGPGMDKGYSFGESDPIGVGTHYFQIHATGTVTSGDETLSSSELTAGVIIPPGG